MVPHRVGVILTLLAGLHLHLLWLPRGLLHVPRAFVSCSVTASPLAAVSQILPGTQVPAGCSWCCFPGTSHFLVLRLCPPVHQWQGDCSFTGPRPMKTWLLCHSHSGTICFHRHLGTSRALTGVLVDGSIEASTGPSGQTAQDSSAYTVGSTLFYGSPVELTA